MKSSQLQLFPVTSLSNDEGGRIPCVLYTVYKSSSSHDPQRPTALVEPAEDVACQVTRPLMWNIISQ